MTMSNDAEVAAWLRIHNDAFQRDWGVDEYRRALLENPDVVVTQTFFALEGAEPVGAVSIGAFRRNERVAVGHYLGVEPRCQGLGLGRELLAHGCRLARESGFSAMEGQTYVSRVPSLFIQFDLGFRPKYRWDHWNNPRRWSATARLLANARLWRAYRRWCSTHP